MIPAFWLRPTVLLSAALAVSGALNIYALYHAGKVNGEHKGEVDRLALQARAEKAETAGALSKQLADMGVDDHAQLLNELEVIAERGRKARIVYKGAASAAPLPSDCSPGQPRVDAVNAVLGGAK